MYLTRIARYGMAEAQLLYGQILLDGRGVRHDPFAGRRPALIRVRTFRYRFATRAERRAAEERYEGTRGGEPPASTVCNSSAQRLPHGLNLFAAKPSRHA